MQVGRRVYPCHWVRNSWSVCTAVFLCLGIQAALARGYFDEASDANVYVAPVDSAIHTVAVLPFKAPTELIGASGSDIFLTEMMRTRRYMLLERSQISGVLGETEIALSGLSDSQAIEAGRMMGADGVILGTVDEYGTVAYRGRSYPVVGASIRLIDCESGRVMWSVGHSSRAESPKATLSGHARNVIHQMVSGLVQNWDVQRQVEEEFDDARGDRDQPDDVVGYDAPAEDLPIREETPPPDRPESFGVSDLGLREVTLEWEAPADRYQKIRIERATAPNGPFAPVVTLPGSRVTYTDAGDRRCPLDDATTYYYRLIAIGRDGQESDPSIALESMTAPPPEPPTELVAETPAGRAVALEWTAPECEGISSYRIERAMAADQVFSEIGETGEESFEEGGTSASPLRDATTYLYRVRAVNRVGAVSEASEAVSVETLPPPTPPEGLEAVSREVRCVPLSWAPHEDDSIVRYEVYRSDTELGPYSYIGSTDGRDSTSYLDGQTDPGTLEDDTTYYYCIRAINDVTAESSDSEIVMATTREPPPQVEGLAVATGLPRRVELSWEPSADEKVIAYELERSEDDGEWVHMARLNGLDVTDYTDEGDDVSRFMRSSVRTPLRDGTAYDYRIRALNTAEATSEWCEPVRATTKVVPMAPTGVRVSEGRARVIGVVWKANPEEDIAEYVIETAANEDGPFSEAGRVDSGGRLGFKQEDLSPGMERYYRVQAVDIDGLPGAWSDPVAGTTKPLPDAPTDLEVEWSEDGALVSWTPPPQEDIARYRLLNKRFMGQDELATSEEAQYFFPMEALKRKLVLMVTAVDADGLESPVSGVLEVRIPR